MRLLTAAWLVVAALIATLVWESSGSPPADVTPVRQRPAATAAAPPGPDAAQRQQWVATVLARPLFSPDRRPAAEMARTEPGLPSLPRLTGIVIGPSGRSAIFAADSRKPIIVQEGTRIAAYTVKTIDATGVSMLGPDGIRVLYPAFAAATGEAGAAAPRPSGQAAPPR